MISNNKIKPILDRIEKAEKPAKFSHSVLKNLGFSSSNDRAIIPLLKRLGFLSDNGAPTEHYDELKDKTKKVYVLGKRIRDLYSELYAINTNIHEAPEDEIKGAMSRVTGKDAKSVNRYFATFKALTNLAKFTPGPITKKPTTDKTEKKPTQTIPGETIVRETGFHYNIQIHLPATTDISVYNAIFKSLKENLLI
jgi:hypothetical protein